MGEGGCSDGRGGGGVCSDGRGSVVMGGECVVTGEGEVYSGLCAHSDFLWQSVLDPGQWSHCGQGGEGI